MCMCCPMLKFPSLFPSPLTRMMRSRVMRTCGQLFCILCVCVHSWTIRMWENVIMSDGSCLCFFFCNIFWYFGSNSWFVFTVPYHFKIWLKTSAEHYANSYCVENWNVSWKSPKYWLATLGSVMKSSIVDKIILMNDMQVALVRLLNQNWRHYDQHQLARKSYNCS